MTAQQTYQNKQISIRQKMAYLKSQLENHADMQNIESSNWGYIGDLGFVEEKLDELIDFMI